MQRTEDLTFRFLVRDRYQSGQCLFNLALVEVPERYAMVGVIAQDAQMTSIRLHRQIRCPLIQPETFRGIAAYNFLGRFQERIFKFL